MLDARGRRLRAALAAVLVRDNAPELRLIHDWLDSWSGIGLIVVGMWHQGFTVSLGEHSVGRWIAVFYHGRGGHEPVAAAGTAQEATPWRAVQRTRGQALATPRLPVQDRLPTRHAAFGLPCGRVRRRADFVSRDVQQGLEANQVTVIVRRRCRSRCR